MGLDFIKSKGGRPWKKSWSKSLDLLKAPGLFELPSGPTTRTVNVDLDASVSVTMGECLLAQLTNKKILLSRGFNMVGTVNQTPDDVSTTLAARGGVCVAVVKRLGLFGDSAEVELQ